MSASSATWSTCHQPSGSRPSSGSLGLLKLFSLGLRKAQERVHRGQLDGLHLAQAALDRAQKDDSPAGVEARDRAMARLRAAGESV